MPDAKLHELNRKFSVLLEHFDGGVLIEDETRHIAYVNQRFCDIFSIPLEPAMLLGFDCAEAAAGSAPLFENPEEFLKKTEKIVRNAQLVNGQQIKMANGRTLERDYIPIIEENNLNAQVWLYRDVSKYLRYEETLKHRLEFEELITKLSYSFITSKTDSLDRIIDFSLEDIGKFIEADRAYVFLFCKELKKMSNTHEWCNQDIIPQKYNLQDLPTTIFPWWMEKLSNFENIVLNSLDELPPEAGAEKEILEAQNIKSLVVVPLVYSFELLGYLGFDSVIKYRTWVNDSVMLLRVFGNLLSGTLKRKENEEKLRASEKRYKSVVDNLTEVIFQTDNDGIWTFLNPAWQTITGFSVEESLGQPFFNYVHPEDRERNYALFLPLVNKEKSYCRHEIRYMKKDESFCWVEVYAKLTYDDNDNVTGTSGTLNDITKRKLNEEEIRKLTKAVENTPTAVVLSDLKGKIVFVNNALLSMGGFNNENEILNKSIFDFADPPGREILAKKILPVLLSGNDWKGEMHVLKSNGTKIPVTMLCSTINDGNDIPQYLLANFIDMTDQKRAEAEIRKAFQREKELSDMKSRFVSLVSHEFRTPLTVILSSTEILNLYSDKFSNDQKEQHYNKIKTSVNNLLDILNEVSEINRIDSGKNVPASKLLNINEFIKEILEEVGAGIREKAEIVVQSNGITDIYSDKKLIRQIIMNLVSNAIKYTPADKRIFILYKCIGSEFYFEITDEGIGIPEKDQERILEPFTRSATVQNIKGSGLGLSIVKKAVDLLNGSLSFVSVEGKGSTFSIKIPCRENNA